MHVCLCLCLCLYLFYVCGCMIIFKFFLTCSIVFYHYIRYHFNYSHYSSLPPYLLLTSYTHKHNMYIRKQVKSYPAAVKEMEELKAFAMSQNKGHCL